MVLPLLALLPPSPPIAEATTEAAGRGGGGVVVVLVDDDDDVDRCRRDNKGATAEEGVVGAMVVDAPFTLVPPVKA